MKTAFSLYLGTDLAHTERAIARAAASDMKLAFSSLQIPEEQGEGARDRALHVMRLCREAGIELLVDVSPRTLEMLDVPTLAGLRDLGVGCVRLDFGFSDMETAELSRTFRIAFNASTVSVDKLHVWEHLGADLHRFIACHNYYPKPLTGLPLAAVKTLNERLRARGIETMAFIPGDAELRGPLCEGLPTVEAHRGRRDQVLENALELAQEAATDIVAVGDPGLSDRSWKVLSLLQRGVVPIRASFEEGFDFLRGSVHRDRVDSSELVIRSVDSRAPGGMANRLKRAAKARDGHGGQERLAGDICLSLASYGRYAGELEVMRVDAPGDDRVAVIGRVLSEDLHLLKHVCRGAALRFA